MRTELLDQPSNLLLEDLPDKEHIRILKLCERVHLVFGDVLYQADQNIEYVYFPESSILGLVKSISGHAPLGITLIGNEGMLGVVLLLAEDMISKHGAVVQNSGSALRMNALALRLEVQANPRFSLKLNHYLSSLIEQISQSSGCAHYHKTEPRLARWLLMTQDRAHSPQFHLTHKILAEMLGVRRSSITIAAGILQSKKLISYHRGEITVIDRKGLEAQACECY